MSRWALTHSHPWLRPHAGWLLLACALALSCLGILAIDTAAASYGNRQARWLLIALAIGGLCAIPRPRTIGITCTFLLGITLALLVFVVAPGVPRSIVPVRNGTRAWINLQFMMLQPSELAKITVVLAMAWFLRYSELYRRASGLLVIFAWSCVPVGLILMEPDLGTAVLFPPAVLAMLVAAGARLRHMAAVVSCVACVIALVVASVFFLPDSMQVLKPHQRQRIIAMVSLARGESQYSADIGYQQDKAVTLVGAGMWSGYGEDRSRTLLEFNRLPEDHNDMIFAVIVNRWGLLGGLATLGIIAMLLLSLLLIASLSRDPFARLAVVGFAAILFAQTTINVGMSLGLMPIIGITLPFVSYGGSSLVANFIMIGLAFNFASRRPAPMARPAFEYDLPPQQLAPR